MSNNKRKAMILGVTGGIACGKSEAGRILNEMGFSVCDADRTAHELMKQGTPVFKEIVEHFGTRILGEDGGISRPRLGEIVFKQPEEREILNRLVHPAVRKSLQRWISEKRRANEDAAVLIPLLFESGMQDLDWDAILCVSSSRKDVFRRLEQRGLTREEAERRVRSHMPNEEKEKLADRVIPNSGTLAELRAALRTCVVSMRQDGQE